MAIGYKGGYIRKKEGASVYFVNQNVKGAVKQVSRAYAEKVNNPKTLGQAKQRALFVAAKNFRRGFEGLLNHSWQGVKYGSPSLSKFMSLVLANKGAGYPNFFLQPRNSMKFIPQPWPLSTGSVAAEIAVNEVSERRGYAYVAIKEPEVTQEDTTMGAYYKKLIAKNPFLADGDMLTFCAVVTDQEDGQYTASSKFAPVFDRIVIDTTSEEAFNLNGLKTQNGVFTFQHSESEMSVNPGKTPFPAMCALGVIVSRRNSVGTSYQRNNAIMVLSEFVATYFGSETYRENCLRSMMDDSFLESTWYLNQVGYDQNAQGGNNIGNNDDDTTIENP